MKRQAVIVGTVSGNGNIKWSKPSINGFQLLSPCMTLARTKQKLLQASSGNRELPLTGGSKGVEAEQAPRPFRVFHLK